jgi:putative oxidoreductase
VDAVADRPQRGSLHDPTVNAADLGLLLLRLVVGLTFAAHGAQKAFGWWAGPGWIGWQNAIGRMGFRPVGLFATLSVGAELVGGLFLALGAFTPFAAALLAAQSTVIIVKVHGPNGFWNKVSGIEFPLALGGAALAIGLTGPGAVSFDAVEGFVVADAVRAVVATAGVVCGVIALAVPVAAASSSDSAGPTATAR